MGEFELIRHYFATTAARQDNVVLGIGDDCALLMPPEGQHLAVSIDTLVEGVHFPVGMAAEHIATRLLGSAVSDLAAMGARPAWFTLALTLPEADPQWLEAFACALAQHAHELDIVLVGGDTTRGPLVLSVQVHGFVEPGKALYRSAAREGDLVAVSGTLGDSHAGLQSLQTKAKANLAVSWLQQRFYRPEPRVELSLALAPHLHAAIDISDGLCADLQHILNSSQVGADIHLERLPLSDALCHWCSDAEQRIDSALAGGDDYELCFTLPQSRWDQCLELAAEVGVQITCIGEITDSHSIPLAVQRVAQQKQEDAIIALGAVIRGGTPHFEYVSGESSSGIFQVMMAFDVPVANGILTVNNIEQAIERSGTKAGNKGAEAAMSALEMVSLLRQLEV